MPDLENDAFFNTNEENDASMNAVIQITTATGSEELWTADRETAATAGKDEKPEIKAEPPSNTHVMGLEKDSEDGEAPKKHDSDKQVSDEEKENQSKVPIPCQSAMLWIWYRMRALHRLRRQS